MPAYVADTDDEARAEARDSLMSFCRYQAELAKDSARLAGGPVAEQRIRRAERLLHLTFEEALATQVMIGSLLRFAERLAEIDAELGLAGILTELNCGGLIPHERVVNAIRLLCEEVKPRFP